MLSDREPTQELPYRMLVTIYTHRGRCQKEVLGPITEQLN